MKRKQLYLLFGCNLVIFLSGSGIMAVLPMYATSLGASNAVIGYYMAAMSLLFAVGTMTTSLLTRFILRRALYILVGIGGAAMLALHVYVNVLWQAVVLTSMVWFFGGIGLALSNTFAAHLADARTRGTVFSLVAVSLPLAALLGGLTVAPLISFWNYTAMFLVLTLLWATWPVSAFLWLAQIEDPANTLSGVGPEMQSVDVSQNQQVRRFLWLLVAGFVASLVISAIRLTVPLSMRELNFSASAIVSVTTVSGLLTIPLALFYGRLSDRLGKKEILSWRYLLLVVSSLFLITATGLWHFWAASLLVFATQITGGSIARALVTDILPPRELANGLNRYESACALAGMLGSIAAGYLIDDLGAPAVYGLSAVFAAIALYALGNVSSEHDDNMTVFLRIEQLVVGWLMRDYTARVTSRAINGAYAVFAVQHPRWAHSLFDAQFLHGTARPVLSGYVTGTGQADARSLANAWTEQVPYVDRIKREKHVDAIAPIAAEFLQLFQMQLPRSR